LNKIKYEKRRIDTNHLGRISIPLSDKKEPDYPGMRTAIAPNFVHSYDASLLKTSFQDWNKPLALIHDQIKVLPNDMDKAMERIRKGFVHICSGDPLSQLADDLWVPKQQVKRLEQGTGCLEDVLDSAYMFN
jgi:DNA-directed RNA polymerase